MYKQAFHQGDFYGSFQGDWTVRK